MNQRILCATVSLAVISACTAAHAQQAPAGASANQVQEVVVTAERRAVNLQKAPVAATVLTGADLVKKGVTNIDQLQQVSPDLTVQNTGQGNFFNIRGIGKSEGSSTVQVGVVTYRDGVATFPGYFQSEPFYDIANIEVLRGPQGTFAGQNATGGAVFITEADPSLSRLSGYAQGQVGNYADRGFQGAINIPLSDTLALRVAENTEYRNSFYSITGQHTGMPSRLAENSARVSLLWQPTSQFKLLVKLDSNDVITGGYAADPATATNNLFHIGNNAYNNGRDVFGRAVINMSYTLNNGIVLRSISGYQKGTTTDALDADGTANPSLLKESTFIDRGDETIYSQEINIVSPDRGPFSWILGGYYQSDLTTFPAGKFISGSPPGVLDITLQGANPKSSTAVFGQVGYRITPDLQLQIGLRDTTSTQRNDAISAIPELHVAIAQNASEADSRLTGKVALNWTINPDNFAYVFAATGHKAGGINGPNIAFVTPRPFAPEDVTDFETGWKSTLLGGHLHTQLDGFYSLYNNFQVTIQDPLTPSISSLYNVPSATKIYGVEASGQAVFGAFSFDFGAAYLHSELGSFYAADPRVGLAGACNLASGPATATCLNLTGKSTSYAPAFSANLGAQYIFELVDGMTLTPRLNYSHTDASWATLFEQAVLGDHLPARDLVNAQLSLTRGGWLMTAYATNLTNQEYVTAVSAGLRYAGSPRQFGLRLRKDF